VSFDFKWEWNLPFGIPLMRCIWKTVLVLVCATLCASPLAALNPTFKISQYLHTAWKSESGLQAVRRLAQTPDGYLWLATRGGLVRFDGARFTTFLAGSVPGLESSTTQDLLVDPDGSLWIATLGGGVSHYQRGEFRSYTIRDGLPSNDIQSLFRDSHGVIWVGTRDGKIARLDHDRFENVSVAIPTASISAFLEDDDHSLWVATFGDGVFRLRNGILTRFSVHEGLPDGRVADLYRDRSGKIWTAGWKGISSWSGSRFVPDLAVNRAVDYAIACRKDRDGNLWVAASSGLFRSQGDRVAKLNRESGLSADFVADVLEDREGDLWSATRGGLDRFREAPVRTFAAREGLLGQPGPVAVGDHSEIWTMSDRQVDRIAAGELSTWRFALPSHNQPATVLFQPDSELLIGFAGGVIRWRPDEASAVSQLAELDVRCMLRAHDGTVWLGTGNRGLVHWNPSSSSGLSLQTVLSDRSIGTLAEDHAGAIWAGSAFGSGLYRMIGEKVQHYGPAEGLESSNVTTVFVDEEGNLWIGSTGGLSWFQSGKLRTANSRHGLPSNQILAIVDDSYGRLWIATYAGIASIEKQSFAEWADGRREMLIPTVYLGENGLQAYTVRRVFPCAIRSPDGHLWFSVADGIAEVTPPDPRQSRGDEFPIRIEDVTIDGISRGRQDHLRIPPGARSIEITYTAIALSNSESIRFRYRLGGMDQTWVNAGARRTAFYNNLKPGAYTFTVSASSGAGQWRDAPGASFVFSIAPAYYQTLWFQALCAAAFLSLLWGLYRIRLYQIAREFNVRLEERTRIARDLHDTLLQSFQGLMLRLQVVEELLPSGKAKDELEQTLERADQAITEGRSAVHDLRSSAATGNDLAAAVRGVADELAGDGSPRFRLVVEGSVTELHPILRDEVYRIAREVLRNAFSHAQAHHIEAEITYSERLFRLRVRDDGCGIPSDVLEAGRSGHYGLSGIRERARQIGASLNIWSGGGTGTEIDLSIPGSIAYGKSPSQPRFSLFRKKVR
jgi:signal transduction histidine kinase/ligand-binding sensor domain-containing protein